MAQQALQEIIEHRRSIRGRHLREGHNPYPQDGHRTYTCLQALAAAWETDVTVCGRVRAMRRHGKLWFVTIEDESSALQIVLKADHTLCFTELDQVDLGDFLRVKGIRMRTLRGEESVLATTYELVAKSLRPLPDSYYGFSDEEERYRRRYLDLIMNKEVKEVFRQRSLIIASIRNTLEKQKFMEVETPTLQPLYGGANARPFTTKLNAFDGMQMYLKISDELYLKRLIIGGFERVYEIDKDFRNEGVSYKHNPEFTMMECYAAYWDYQDMMALTEEIYRDAAIAATGAGKLVYHMLASDANDHQVITPIELDFGRPWQRLTMYEAIYEHLQIDVEALDDVELYNVTNETRRKLGKNTSGDTAPFVRGLKIVELFECVEHKLIQPTFITDFPRETTALCKPHRSKPELIERFEPYIAGMEVGNAYTELNDPVLQREFMEAERGDEAHPLDEDFIEAMEYGMPPTGGLGLGIDRMVMLLTNRHKIRDVLLFPLMKPRT